MKRHSFNGALIGAGCLALALAPRLALAQTSSLALAESRSNVTAYVGALGLDKGFHDRSYGGFFYNQYFGSVGLHADVVSVSREKDSTFAAVGLSWDAGPMLRPKIMLGTSTDNPDIHPDEYASLQVQIRPTPDSRTIVTPSLTYRHFRTGAQEIMPGLDGVYYFSVPSDVDGYYVVQAGGNVSINGHNNTDGYTVGAGLQTVRSNGVSFGVYAEGGRMVYDALIGAGIKTDFYSIRPSIGLRFNPEWELFARGEYTHTGIYEIRGGLIGLKFSF
jgi:hypothetical protein